MSGAWEQLARDACADVLELKARVRDAQLVQSELIKALEMVSYCLSWHAEKNAVGMDCQALIEARKAIAKAKGEAA